MSNNVLRWLMPFSDLDYEQQAVINNTLRQGTTLLYGPAGSGKTAITLYCAKLLNDLRRSYHVFVYTNVLHSFLLAGMSELGLAPESLTTLYRWVRDQYSICIGTPTNEGDDPYSQWVDALIHRWSHARASMPHFDYVLVDEAQDFKANVATLLHMVSNNLLIVADPAQSLYEEVTDVKLLEKRWGPIAARFEVPRNYRNPSSIARAAATFASSFGVDADEFMRRVKGKSFDQKPIWYQVNSTAEQSECIRDIIQQARGSVRIGLLCRHRRQVFGERTRLAKLGQPVQVALSSSGSYDFNSPSPVLTTVHSAKGLEFDWVILPFLNADSWDDECQDDTERHLFFVALTRAKERLYLVSETGCESVFLGEIARPELALLQRPQVENAKRASTSVDLDMDSPF